MSGVSLFVLLKWEYNLILNIVRLQITIQWEHFPESQCTFSSDFTVNALSHNLHLWACARWWFRLWASNAIRFGSSILIPTISHWLHFCTLFEWIYSILHWRNTKMANGYLWCASESKKFYRILREGGRYWLCWTYLLVVVHSTFWHQPFTAMLTLPLLEQTLWFVYVCLHMHFQMCTQRKRFATNFTCYDGFPLAMHRIHVAP